jgi:hypothetical protein
MVPQPMPETSLAELLCTFAFASDLALGLELEDSLRGCYIADRIAEELGLAPADRLAAYYGSLVKDIGCTCWNSERQSSDRRTRFPRGWTC